ncbi:hypothetical protein TI05_11395 [Achromatium sp. WMS3]|nr:hypothetical protein TI05_11395 [Achromatium sp. WMS3]
MQGMRLRVEYIKKIPSKMSFYVNTSILLFWLGINYHPILFLLKKIQTRLDVLLIFSLLLITFGYLFLCLRIATAPKIARLPLLLFCISAIFSLLNTVTIEIPQFQLMFLFLGIYAWLGLQVSAWSQWQRHLNIAILLSFILPFYLDFSSGLGFLLRLLTAQFIEQTLHNLGIYAISSYDVIITENAIAHIDIPCSGLKSLWVGSAFFLAALVILKVRINWGTLGRYLLVIGLLLSANTFRVLILTLLTTVYSMHTIAKMLHVPLGILGFSVSLVIGWLLLLYAPKTNNILVESPILVSPILVKPKFWLISLFSLFLGQLSILIASKNPLSQQINKVAVLPPAAMQTSILPLTPGEKRYFARGLTTIAQKWRFNWKFMKGSMLIVHSQDFNMFHAPELCMVANGILVDSMQTMSMGSNSFRLLSLNQGTATGIYWLQSANFVTDDFGVRYWQYIFNKDKDWRMVVVILQIPYPPDKLIITDLINCIRASFINNITDKQ